MFTCRLQLGSSVFVMLLPLDAVVYTALQEAESPREVVYAPAIEHTDSRKQKQTSHEISSLAVDLHTLSSLASPQNIPDAQKAGTQNSVGLRATGIGVNFLN